MIVEGKVVAVIGVGEGLGQEVARVALRDGARVVAGARNEEKLKSLCEELVEYRRPHRDPAVVHREAGADGVERRSSAARRVCGGARGAPGAAAQAGAVRPAEQEDGGDADGVPRDDAGVVEQPEDDDHV